MTTRRVFVSLAWPDRADVGWTRRFAAALRRHGQIVAEEWGARDRDSREAAERALRQSDLLVSLTESNGTGSPNFSSGYGVAIARDKDFVAVVPAGLDLEGSPTPIRHGKHLVKGTPTETAAALLARAGEWRTPSFGDVPRHS